MAAPSDVLTGFDKDSFEALGVRRDVWRIGSGPAVIVICEVPGITPLVIAFARRVAESGMSVAMPHLFGEDGREPTGPHLAATVARLCVSREFTLLATGRSSPVVAWLRELASSSDVDLP